MIYSFLLPPGIFIFIILLLAVWAMRQKIHKLFVYALCLIALLMYIISIPIFCNKYS